MLSYARSQGSLILMLLVLSPAVPQVARRDIEEKGKEPRVQEGASTHWGNIRDNGKENVNYCRVM